MTLLYVALAIVLIVFGTALGFLFARHTAWAKGRLGRGGFII